MISSKESEKAMLEITATEAWRQAHPGATIGLFELSGIDNSVPSPALNARKLESEARLRERYRGFVRPDFLALPLMAAYDRYYNRFDKTYHVLLQLESLVLKGKHLPNVSPAVDANFMAEVETLVLTAGHDVQKLSGPVSMDVSRAGDQMGLMSGESRAIRAGDMIMRDAGGVSCSILYGQDARSPISPQTTHVLYVAYAPPGVPDQAILGHFAGIEGNTRLFAPGARVEQRRVIRAD
jgi:DNA/RNA-binding domain of Phe-tRNA-synthetase-like protein